MVFHCAKRSSVSLLAMVCTLVVMPSVETVAKERQAPMVKVFEDECTTCLMRNCRFDSSGMAILDFRMTGNALTVQAIQLTDGTVTDTFQQDGVFIVNPEVIGGPNEVGMLRVRTPALLNPKGGLGQDIYILPFDGRKFSRLHHHWSPEFEPINIQGGGFVGTEKNFSILYYRDVKGGSDFVLETFTGAGKLERIGVLPKEDPRTLLDFLGYSNVEKLGAWVERVRPGDEKNWYYSIAKMELSSAVLEFAMYRAAMLAVTSSGSLFNTNRVE